MDLKIVWTPRALDTFLEVIQYLEQNWPEQTVRNFVIRTEEVLKILAKHPQMYRRISDKSSTREAVVTKHNLFLYRIQKDNIAILAVFDTRQHPKKKKLS